MAYPRKVAIGSMKASEVYSPTSTGQDFLRATPTSVLRGPGCDRICVANVHKAASFTVHPQGRFVQTPIVHTLEPKRLYGPAGRLPHEQTHLRMRRFESRMNAELLERFRRRRTDRSDTALAQRRQGRVLD